MLFTSVEHAEKQIAYRERSVPPLDQKLWTYFGDGKSMDGCDQLSVVITLMVSCIIVITVVS